jgi:hypothetical protein
MKIKLISKGHKNGRDTAQIVLHYSKGNVLQSQTVHLWRQGATWIDWVGNKYEL